MEAKSLVNGLHDAGRHAPDPRPGRCTATERTCSACALETRRRPVAGAGRSTENG